MSPAERTPEEWGRVAVGLPGWRWMPGMVSTQPDDSRPMRWYGTSPDTLGAVSDYSGKDRWPADDAVPDPDDPATAGCLEALLGDEAWRVRCIGATAGAWCWEVVDTPDAEPGCGRLFGPGEKGRACIAAAEALGRWPGGER